ncbi:T9SS type A sorting domain-containing protein [uncultured Flavobacterium sp.]|uniref:T9SS type A sorting domain-containing protein n=1 Tax=uncultured Flavobacterium sp. TaxID=165435 RepID=UPI0025D9FCA1|nr:T9SS type A sorting domain-containing protein [uncultured Flavobacterium sp.]
MNRLILLLISMSCTIVSAQCFEKVASGFDHNLAIKQDGTLWSWGSNDAYQLGDPSIEGSDYPMQIHSSGWTDIAGGANHSLGIKDGKLYSWGNDQYEQLGNGSNVGQHYPQQIGADTNWKQVTAGMWHSAAIKTDGTLWTWGSNWYGSLGLGWDVTYEAPAPQQVGTDTNWKYVSGTYTHCVAVKTDGTLWAWGNAQGVGGNSGLGSSPVQADGNNWKIAEAGQNFIVAIKNDGTLWVWGGLFGTNTFSQVGFATDWATISVNKGSTNQGYNRYFLLTTTNGKLYSWGSDNYEQLGNGPGIQDNSVPTQIGTDMTWTSTTATTWGSFAIKADGTFWVWGRTCMDLNDNCASNTPVALPVQYSCSVLSVNDDHQGKRFLIYPNPVKAILNLDLNNDIVIDEITITDITGKSVIEHLKNSRQINVECLTQGVYFIKVHAGEKEWRQKFIKN